MSIADSFKWFSHLTHERKQRCLRLNSGIREISQNCGRHKRVMTGKTFIVRISKKIGTSIHVGGIRKT